LIPALLLLAFTTVAGDVDFVESRLTVAGTLSSYETPDVDADGRGDVITVAIEDGERVLRVHRQTASGAIPSDPSFRLVLPEDVSAYALLDLREEPGREILLFTKSGVFSLSPTRRGLRGNIQREFETPLFPDLAASDDVLRWEWVLDVDGDGEDELLIPTRGAFLILDVARGAEAGDRLRAGAAIPCPVEEAGNSRGVDVRIGRANFEVQSSLPAFFPGRSGRPASFGNRNLLRRSESWTLPRLLDWNGDGRLDAVTSGESSDFDVREQESDGRFGDVAHVSLPGDDETDVIGVRVLDLDGDGTLELIRLSGESSGLSRDYGATVWRLDDGEPAPEPTARVKLSASSARFSFHDVDGDGRLDLIVNAVELPTGIDQLTSIRIESRVIVFRGGVGGTLARRPSAQWQRTLRPDDLARARESFIAVLDGDYDGDRLADLVVLRPDGLCQVVPLRAKGDGLEFASEPSSTVMPKRSVREASAAQLSHDQVSDLVLRHEDGLTIFVSATGEPSR